MNTLTTDERVALNRAVNLLNIFRRVDPNTETTLSEAASLLLIALGETKDGGGLSQVELAGRGEFSEGSASRYAKSLSIQDRQGRKGLGLITAVRDPLSERRKVLRLTSEGASVISKIVRTLEKTS